MQKFLIALQFLTILPVRIKSEPSEQDIRASLVYFPLVGTLIGAFLAVILFVFNFLPQPVMAALVLIASIVITGGMHLDGFADTCDGFYGNRPREKMLEIMRDSRVGAMGVMGIVSVLLLKFTLLLALPKTILPLTLILMTTFARWSQTFACFTSGYAREEGKGRAFIGYNSKKGFFIAGAFTIFVFLSLMRFKGIIFLAFSLVPVGLFITYIKKKLGGMTGDTVGAVSELAEIAMLFSFFIPLQICSH
jgi:adenosylcobinamide-GDP ribazoletransferase